MFVFFFFSRVFKQNSSIEICSIEIYGPNYLMEEIQNELIQSIHTLYHASIKNYFQSSHVSAVSDQIMFMLIHPIVSFLWVQSKVAVRDI